MRRSSISALLRPIVLLAAVFLPSCVESKHPLSDPDESKSDERLFGAWKVVDKEAGKGRYGFIFIGKSEYSNAPAGLMTVVSVGNDKDNRVEVKRLFHFFPTRIGREDYANCFDDDPVANKGERPKWDKSCVPRYIFAKYTVEGEHLTVSWMSPAAAEKAMRSRQLKGTIEERGNWLFKLKWITLTDSQGLSRFLAGGGGKQLFPGTDKMVFVRVK